MLEKSQAISLHTIRYGESSLVAYIYTRDFGRVTLMVNGAYGKSKSSKKAIFFQPLNLINIVFYKGKNHGMGRLKEIVFNQAFTSIPYNPIKTAIALFVGEVIYRTIKEEESNPNLFDFIQNSVKSLDIIEEGIANFHLVFLANLSKFLGFYPNGNYSDQTPFFDYKNGIFVQFKPHHPMYFNRENSEMLSVILRTQYENAAIIPLNRHQRTEFLELMLSFFAFHMDGTQRINSITVLNQVFG
jgi:DNA repair protein RecO (recombination protein O)